MKKTIKFVKKNWAIITVFIIVMVITAASTYYAAETLFASANVSYDNTNLTSTNVQDALDELYGKAMKCPNAPVKIGNYISLTPTQTSYTIKKSLTGYTSDQTINPSELNLWRVIDIHSDGSFDAVSEYVSSTGVYFRGTTGYANLVGALNTIAAQYQVPGYTIGSRHMGYGGQTSIIGDTSAFDGTTNTAPGTTSTPDPYTGTGEEYNGGVLGDTLYLKDIQLVGNVYKTDTTKYGNYGLKAYIVNDTARNGNYWLASRRFDYYSATRFFFYARSVNSNSLSYYNLRNFSSGGYDGSCSYSVRPIITLKSGIQIAGGSGTITEPYTITT